ncbi:AraC family transcriptional regulator [Streptomyces thermolilacinus SPC6]|uniref:AraC family transcriptional regulator n=2 Tax=Streptomyces thermolilacinus TaxID=285540 RepID=A0A1D3DN89_9ACTN|nr:AraC family transcriptional regulator [Streptomyces thermolilacinus SPC6]
MDLLWSEGRLLVAGPDTRAYVSENPDAAWAGVRFAPGDAPALLGVPAYELRDRRVEPAELWPAACARRLAARVAAATDRAGAATDGAATALEEAVLCLAAEAPRPDPLLRAVAARLDAGWSVAATAEAVGLGARQLHRRSLDAFGYGPKTLARILRLQRALALVRAGTPYAEAAAVAGYTDQAHLARDTRALTDRTLTAYAAEHLAERPPGTPQDRRADRRADYPAGRAASANRSTPRPSGSRTTA